MDSVQVRDKVSSIKQRFPGRNKQVDIFIKLIGEPCHLPCQAVFCYGHAATGKSSLLKALMEDLQLCYVWVNCFETYNQRLLLEAILKQLYSDDASYPSCDNVCDFLRLLKQCNLCRNDDHALYLVLDNAERARDLPPTLLASLFRLQELSGLGICTLLLSEIIWEKFRCGIGYREPFLIHFPEYDKGEVLAILLRDQPSKFSKDFFCSYLNLVLSIFYLTTRDVRELRYIALSHFSEYCRPLQSGEAKEGDVRKLWRNIEPTLRRALDCVYLREASNARPSDEGIPAKVLASDGSRALVELPFYSKFLLLAAYMASYNPANSDRRFFLKNQGRTKKKRRNVTSNQPDRHLKGPKAFPLHRLLAIFYAIVEEKVAPSAALFSQISSLVTLRLLSMLNDDCASEPKYKCLVGLDLIRNIARTVGFDIVEHLYDFT